MPSFALPAAAPVPSPVSIDDPAGLVLLANAVNLFAELESETVFDVTDLLPIFAKNLFVKPLSFLISS